MRIVAIIASAYKYVNMFTSFGARKQNTTLLPDVNVTAQKNVL